MGNTVDRIYFDIIPSDLKYLLLSYIPAESLDILCGTNTFKNICMNDIYWNDLYHKEFSQYQNADFGEYFNARNIWDAIKSTEKTSLVAAYGWEHKLIPLIDTRRDLFISPNSEGYELVKQPSLINKFISLNI